MLTRHRTRCAVRTRRRGHRGKHAGARHGWRAADRRAWPRVYTGAGNQRGRASCRL